MTLQGVQPFVGMYYSHHWVQTHVLRMTDDDIEDQREKIIEEQEDPIFNPPMPEAPPVGPDGQPLPGPPPMFPSQPGPPAPPPQQQLPPGVPPRQPKTG